MSLFQSPHVRLFVGAVLISFSPVFVNLVSVSPTAVGFYRVLIGGAALAVFILATGRRLSFTKGVWRALVAAAVFFALDLWFWHRSIVYIGPGVATLISNMQVFFMMAAGALLLRQRPSALQVLAVPLAVGGLAMIVAPEWNGTQDNYRLGVLFRRTDRNELRGLHAVHARCAPGRCARRTNARGGDDVADHHRDTRRDGDG